MSTDYSNLSRAQLETRCAAAEAVCVMFGWAPARISGAFEADDAVTELWQQWTKLVPEDFTSPKSQGELNESIAILAARRRATWSATLARISGGAA